MLSDRTVRISRLLAVVFLLVFNKSASGLLHPDADSATLSAIHLNYNDCQQIKSLFQTWPRQVAGVSQLAIRYNQPMAQLLSYSNDFVGPTGQIILPKKRLFSSSLQFSLKTINKEVAFAANDKQSVIVVFAPGKISETWLFNKSLSVKRSYYQPQNFPGTIIRFNVKNLSPKKLRGFRLKAGLYSPEISGLNQQQEADDDLISDPRTSSIYICDAAKLDENWLALAWAPEGGAITAGNPSYNYYKSNHINNDDTDREYISMETPVVDLEPGQSLTSEFVIIWGLDKATVAQRIEILRKKSGFSNWKKTIIRNSEQGLTISSDDPFVDYVYQMIKAWNQWQVDRRKEETIIWPALDSTTPASPHEIAGGIRGLLALGFYNEVKNYIHQWLDKRQESPDAVYVIQMIYDYISYTRDIAWLKENAFRIQELFKYIEELDEDQDGLPNYRLVLQPYGEVYPNEPIFNIQETDLQLLKYSLASIEAYRSASELFQLIGKKRYPRTIKKLKALYRKAVQVLEENYWESQLGQQGFYSYARLDARDVTVYKQHIAAINCYINNIGDPDKQKKVFQDCWTNKNWINETGYYRTFRAGREELTTILPVNKDQYEVDYTHKVLMAGLLTKSTAQEALKRTKDYSKMLCTNPQILAMPGDYDRLSAGMNFSALSYIELLLRGLAGVQITPQGLIINPPAVRQSLELTINNLQVHGKQLAIKVKTKPKGRAFLRINKKKVKFGELIKIKDYKNRQIHIEIGMKYSSKYKKRPSKRTKKSRNRKRR